MSKFFVALSGYSLLLFLPCHYAEALEWDAPNEASIIILSLAVFTAILYLTLVYFQHGFSNGFPLAYLASIAFKLIVSMGFLIILIRRNPQHSGGLSALFLASYIGFTAIEVFFLSKRFLK